MRRCVVALAALVLVSGLAGCGRLLGQRYDNFTAYYNTFYNAKRAFEREEEELLTRERPVARDRYLPLFVEPEDREVEGFAKAVEKGADLLREHPDSKWVDDALLLIGKAYYYQGNATGAEQKFREVIALNEDRLEDEARFWLGRTLAAAERYDDAALALREGLDREGVRSEWAGRMRLALADIDVRQGEWEEAVASLQAGLDGLRDDELAARATFLLGQVFERLDRPADAADAYDRVLDFGPRYQLSYAAQISRALTLGLGGEGERAVEALRRMLRDDKNFESRAEIELTRARVLAALGRPTDARDLLRRLLYDPDPSLRVGALQGAVHYRLAEIYRDGLGDYIRAAAHYDTAATALRRPDLLDREATVQAITDAPDRSETFSSFARVAGTISEMDSLLYLGGLDDEAFAEAIEQIRQQRIREEEERARQLARRRTEQGFRGGPGLEGFGEGAVTDARPGTDAGPADENAGFLNFRNPVRVQEELIGFQARWGDRPLVPNWRRAAAIGGGVAVQEGVAETLGDLPQIETPLRTRDEFVDTAAIPRDPFTQQQMRAERAAARYELGNVLFLSLAKPDSASVLYRSVIEEDEESPIAQRAYFALAEAQRALGNTGEAEQLYNEVIVRYPESRFADQARSQLGLDAVERVAAADSVGLAEAAYTTAYDRWKAGDYADALRAMLALSEAYATTPVAARARLAAGSIYTEWASGNEEVLLASEPLVLSDPDLPLPDTSEAVVREVGGEDEGEIEPPAVDSLALQIPAQPAGFTWVVASEDAAAAAAVAEGYRARGFDALVVAGTVENRSTFRVGIGRFPSRAEALAARTALPDDVPDDTWLLKLPAEASSALPPVASLPVEDEPVPPAPDRHADETAEETADETDQRAEALADTLVGPPDPLPTETPSEGFDLGAIAADSTLLQADSTLAVEEAEVPPEPWLETLYASIETDFPGTPFAERARVLRTVIGDLREEPELDEPSAETDEDALRAAGWAGLWGNEPIDALKGAVTWSILATPSRERAEVLASDTAKEGYRTALYTEEGEEGAIHHVVVGQFASEAIAESMRDELLNVPDVEDLVLLTLEPGAALTPSGSIVRSRDQ